MRFLILCIMVMIAPMSAHAEARGHIAYCDDADSTAAIQNCVNKHHAAAQDKLNTVYETLIADLEGEALEQLRSLQASWIEYRDAECVWESGRVESESLKKIHELSCETRMTENRASLLEATYKNEDETKQADLSGFPRWMNALTEDYPDVFWRFGERERIDLNCDGAEDIVMLGAAVSRIKTIEVDGEEAQDSEDKRTPHALDVVVAITENSLTGRPKSQLFRLPIAQGLEGPSLCSEKVSLHAVSVDDAQDNKKEDSEEGAENADDGEEAQPSCNRYIEVQAKQCPAVTLSWSGKDYELSAPSDPDEDKETNQ